MFLSTGNANNQQLYQLSGPVATIHNKRAPKLRYFGKEGECNRKQAAETKQDIFLEFRLVFPVHVLYSG